MTISTVDGLLRHLAPQALAVLTRRYGQFDACEDAVQDALVAASQQWPEQGVPEHPRGWLIAVATRRLIDEMRADRARRAREDAAAEPEEGLESAPEEQPPEGDDTLTLLFLCCHPAVTAPSQIALTLRAVGGLTTAEIAHAFLVPEATMARRISRAKETIKASGMRFSLPPRAERPERLRAVRHVLYLVFNEAYLTSAGSELQRVELAEEAIRLARMLHRLLPDDGESTGLLALMLLTHARRAARAGADGVLIPLAEQDRGLWDRGAMADGVQLVEHALATAPIGPYQLQAAIAAVHAEARSAGETDWRQIVGLYTLLERLAPNPIFALNRAVAVAMADGPDAGLAQLAAIEGDERLAGHHRVDAVRAHMLELAGEPQRAADSYRAAARQTTSLPEQRYLAAKVAAIESGNGDRHEHEGRDPEDDDPGDVDASREWIAAGVVVEGRDVLEPCDRADERCEAVDQPAADADRCGDPRGSRSAAVRSAEGERDGTRGEPEEGELHGECGHVPDRDPSTPKSHPDDQSDPCG